MLSFKDFIRWYNNKVVVPTLEAMKKMIEFYHSKRIDLLNLDCTSPCLANICLHSSTNVKFYPFPQRDKDLLSIVGIDASQLYPYAMCQPMPTRLYTRWELMPTWSVSNLDPIKPDRLKTWIWLFFRTGDQNVSLRAFTQRQPSERITNLALMGFEVTVTHFLKLWVASITFANVRKCNLVLQMKTLWGHKRREKWTNYVNLTCQKKSYSIIEMWDCQWKFHQCEDHELKSFVRSIFSLRTSSLLWELTFSHSEGRVVWLRTMLSMSTRKLAIEIRIFSTDFRKYTLFTLKNWRLHQKIRRRKQINDSTLEIVKIQFSSHKRYNCHTASKLFFGSWIRMRPNLSFRSIHSNKMF